MSGLLRPGVHRVAGLVDDAAVLGAMLRVEVAWSRALVVAGLAPPRQADVVADAAIDLAPDLGDLIEAAENTGNPATALIAHLRSAVQAQDPDAAGVVHRGLTSQDVVDSALMTIARDGVARLRGDLRRAGAELAVLAERHRGSVMAGRTLTQWAVPTTFGLKAAQWLAGVSEAVTVLDALRFPVQYGGAAGTRALLAALTGDADQAPVVRSFAEHLGLHPASVPWHTRRRAVTAIGDALVTVTDALGVVAADVLLLSRPEIAEVSEGESPARGGSSTMPHKRNPVLSVLVASAARQAPQLAATLHLAAAGAVDERPDGAWHSEWPALAALLEIAVTAGEQAAELVAGLQVHPDAMAARAQHASTALLAESPGLTDVRGYLGDCDRIIEAVLTEWAAVTDTQREDPTDA
ncbi:lyase family protein [Cumulibacter manganitolerans]|uniref:lyase family protein n=1 Tax=Cumulibacter manganitolerans TaxID=1884992 RepID=UPI001297FA12|nr:lyase family protein [Cumulibacter manganitolerans]